MGSCETEGVLSAPPDEASGELIAWRVFCCWLDKEGIFSSHDMNFVSLIPKCEEILMTRSVETRWETKFVEHMKASCILDQTT